MPVDRGPVPSPTAAPAPAGTATRAAPARPDHSASTVADAATLRALESLHGDGADA
jgi:hypothetical protein